MDFAPQCSHYGGVKEMSMKFASRKIDPAVAPVPEGLSGIIRDWAQSLFDKAHDPSHCSRCGVYLPAQNRICDPCSRQG
jgi:hypothetical protein